MSSGFVKFIWSYYEATLVLIDMFFLNLKLNFMKRKITVYMLAIAMLVSGAIYAGNFLSEPIDTDCEFTGNSSESCRYSTGGVNYRVLNCVPNGSDCAFDKPVTPETEINP